MGNDRSWIAPITGAVFVVLAIVSFALLGDSPTVADDSAQEIASFYADNESKLGVSAILEAIGATMLVFFGGYLRRVLRDAEGAGGILSAVAFAGTIIFATGLAIDASLALAMVEASEDI